MFGVRVVVQNDKMLFRPGNFAEVHIVIGEKKDVLIVPREAVVDDRVFVIRDSMALLKKPSFGWLTDDYAEIVSGIDDHATVVLTGNKALPDSALVHIRNTPVTAEE
jgi:hypothetical protein